MKTVRPLFVVAAGSGGHILPALQWAKTIHNALPAQPIILFTGPSHLEQSIANSHDFITEVKTFSIDKFAVRKFWRYPKIALQVTVAIIKSFYYVLRYRPTEMISTGGLLTIPVALAARLTGCKVHIHELNVVPGKAVLFLLPWITTVFVCFEKTNEYCHLLGKDFSYKCVFKDYPVRFSPDQKNLPHGQVIENINQLLLEDSAHGSLSAEALCEGRKPVEPHERSYPSTSSGRAVDVPSNQDNLLFSPNLITIVLLGGSQGSVGLNTLFKNFITGNPEMHNKIQIIHQTGGRDQAGWDEFYHSNNIPALTFAFSDRVAEYYVVADILISRAGAGSMFEALFFAKPTIVVPLVASSTSHQLDNALELARVHPEIFTLVDQQAAVRDQTLFDKPLAQKIAALNH